MIDPELFSDFLWGVAMAANFGQNWNIAVSIKNRPIQ